MNEILPPEVMAEITLKDVEELLTYFEKNTYRVKESNDTSEKILNKCLELWELDYKCLTVPNIGGELCNSYPNKLIIPECENSPDGLQPPELCPLSLTTSSPLSVTSPSPLSLTPQSLLPPMAPSFSSVVAGKSNGGGSTTASTLTLNCDIEADSANRKGSLPGDKSGVDASEAQTEGSRLRELILKAKVARCRARFPVPAILYKGNYISRSSTLSGGPEMYGRSGIEYLFASPKADEEDDEEVSQGSGGDWQLFDRVRSQDIRLLRACNIGVIVDLMVEKKKVKFGMYVTSSEKVDKENRYSDFSIVSLPYPGCEFFKEFRDFGYNGEGLCFNWCQAFVDAHLVIPERSISSRVAHDWNNYRKWDLVRLTQNYLKLLLTYAHEGSAGLLVHCISGWDRTPLFISLLRLSLWADGLIHSSLDPLQILYLTIAYDWLLFGHDLQDRLSKGEEIFFFCFYFLKFITSDDFTVGRKRHMSSDSFGSERLDGCVLLDVDGLSSAGSSTSLNSSCSSNRSSHPAPTIFIKTGGRDHDNDLYNANLTWPYGSFTGELDFDDMSPNLSRTSSSSSHHGSSSNQAQAFHSNTIRDNEKSSSSSNGRLSVQKSVETIVPTKVPRTKSDNLKSGVSNGCKSKTVVTSFAAVTAASTQPLVCPVRTKRKSDSSGESVGSSIGGSSLGCGLIDIDSIVNNGCSVASHATTSPMAVPVPRGRNTVTRTRNESVSSVGSWQIISGTGSLRSSCGSQVTSSSGSKGSHTVPVDMVDSATTIKEEVGSVHSANSEQSIIVFNRAERLTKVRSMFYNIYCTSIGFKFSNGKSESGLGNLMNNFAAKVGIKTSSPRTTSS